MNELADALTILRAAYTKRLLCLKVQCSSLCKADSTRLVPGGSTLAVPQMWGGSPWVFSMSKKLLEAVKFVRHVILILLSRSKVRQGEARVIVRDDVVHPCT